MRHALLLSLTVINMIMLSVHNMLCYRKNIITEKLSCILSLNNILYERQVDIEASCFINQYLSRNDRIPGWSNGRTVFPLKDLIRVRVSALDHFFIFRQYIFHIIAIISDEYPKCIFYQTTCNSIM